MENVFDELTTKPFADRILFAKSVEELFRPSMLRHEVNYLGWDGYLKKVENKCVCHGDDEYYVYLWRHAWGEPFYVGSGKGNRWKNKNARCDDFYLHLDAADAVVYLVLDGVDAKTAHLYETYVSVNLGRAGYTLANGDNNFEYATEQSRQRMIDKCDKLVGTELTNSVENAVLEIIGDRPNCDYRITEAFIMERGADYFSRNHVFNKRHRA